MSNRYISDRFLPDKAIDLIDEAGSRLRIKRMATAARPARDPRRSKLVACRPSPKVDAAVERAGIRRGRPTIATRRSSSNENGSRPFEPVGQGTPKATVDLFDEVDEDDRRACWFRTGPASRVQARSEEESRQAPQHGRPSCTSGSSARRTPSRWSSRSHPPLARRPEGSQAPDRASFMFLGPTGVGKTESRQDAGRVPCSATNSR